MKKLALFLSLFFVLTIHQTQAQDKKVAVVTFYMNKMIDLQEFGPVAVVAMTKLAEDSLFNLRPQLNEFHQQFFDVYSKQFPFQLVPEDQVINNADYKTFVPPGEGGKGLFKDYYNLAYPGYKVMLPVVGHGQERDVLKTLQCDGVMKVYINFTLEKIGFAGMGVAVVNAHANFALFDKNGDQVFSYKEDAKSKPVTPLVAGVPIMTPDKILPMCESAMNKVMEKLQKDMPKMIKKANEKL